MLQIALIVHTFGTVNCAIPGLFFFEPTYPTHNLSRNVFFIRNSADNRYVENTHK